MFALAFFLGVFSYIIFFLGIFHFLYPVFLIPFSLFSLLGMLFILIKKLPNNVLFPTDLLGKIFFLLLILQTIVNSIGVLGPELGFDALWYHGTLPKLYLINHAIINIPYGLFYYAYMPKLIEMIYTAALSFGFDGLPKIVHFGLGIACCLALFSFAKKYFSKTLSLMIVVIFYSNLVVGWESISGYIDLGRTFFEILALSAFVEWSEKNNRFWFLISSVMIGLAITTKLLAFGSLAIFCILIAVRGYVKKQSLFKTSKDMGIFLFISILIPLPWMIFSLIYTGNPVYPFFTSAYPISSGGNIVSLNIFKDLWTLFTASADPISPVYIACIPLIIFYFKKTSFTLKLVYVYSILALVVWYITPRTGGGRFILPYLPAFSLLVGFSIQQLNKTGKIIAYALVIIISIISITYRGVANAKFIPVIFGQQTKEQFLAEHLNFSFGDFYDTDGYFSKHIHKNDLVYVYGFHNLYYVNFPFTLNSLDSHISYIAIQGNYPLPKEFQEWKKVYENKVTHVVLYKK